MIEGSLTAPNDARFAVVVSRFNEMISRRLLDGALRGFTGNGVAKERVDVAWCPGAFEIPLVARTMAETDRYAAVVCLGAVIRGETAHFEYVSGGAADGIQRAMIETSVPMLFGVLTVDTVEQAIQRAGADAGNKGEEAARGALEMADLLSRIRVD